LWLSERKKNEQNLSSFGLFNELAEGGNLPKIKASLGEKKFNRGKVT